MSTPSGGIATEHAILVEASAAGEWQAIPEAVLFGILLGVLYDVFRILAASAGLPSAADTPPDDSKRRHLTARLRALRCRRVTDGRAGTSGGTPRRRVPGFVLQLLLDLLYFLLCGVLGAVFLYWRNDGILRWYLVLAGILGFSAYHATAGVLVMRLCGLVLALLYAARVVLWNTVLYPPLRMGYRLLVWLGRRFRAAGKRIGQRLWHKAGKTTKKRKGILWQRKKSSRKKRSASSRKSRSSSSSASAASPSSG
ncbi:MAG: spore cortex biosynthesis protein YabQ [Clostridia bacterium]|nr:spore cortex biosynthesis protein YabQ [Clostridia bacterium]